MIWTAAPRRLGFVLLAVMAAAMLAPAAFAGQAAAPGLTVDADLLIPKADITRTARYYPVEIEGYRMEVIAVRAPDKSVRVVFNACQVCFSSGKGFFTQSGDDLVCENCGNHYPTSSLEIARGGCNPVPVGPKNRKDDGTNIVVPKAFLERAKKYFSSLK